MEKREYLIYLRGGHGMVLDGNCENARNDIIAFDNDFKDWPQDCGLYEQGDGLLILEAEVKETEDDTTFENPQFKRVTESQFQLIQTFGTIWFE